MNFLIKKVIINNKKEIHLRDYSLQSKFENNGNF